MRFKEDKAFSCQSSHRLRVNPAGPPLSQLMLTELMAGVGGSLKAGSPAQSEWFQERAWGKAQTARLGGRPGEAPQSRPRPPQDPQAYGAGSWQSQAKGQMLGDLFHLQTISKMAGMFCFSKEPPGKAFIAQAECGDRYPPPTARHPSPRRLQRFNESEAATPTSASLQKLSAFLGAETSPVTLPWLMQTRIQDQLSKMLQGLLQEAGFRCHFPEHLTINVCVLENDDMLFSKSPGSSTQPTLKGGAGTFCLECLAMGGASECLCTSRKTGDNLTTPQAS